ncbi:MAG: hypothetical protein LBU32_10735 [Clostridiales bacterium]|nr:hypothetical protein [Clostridiales bacterium]
MKISIYAGALGYPKASTKDPRRFTRLLGEASKVEALGGKWAHFLKYGEEIAATLCRCAKGRGG